MNKKHINTIVKHAEHTTAKLTAPFFQSNE
jgi:hypothetical protein